MCLSSNSVPAIGHSPSSHPSPPSLLDKESLGHDPKPDWRPEFISFRTANASKQERSGVSPSRSSDLGCCEALGEWQACEPSVDSGRRYTKANQMRSWEGGRESGTIKAKRSPRLCALLRGSSTPPTTLSFSQL